MSRTARIVMIEDNPSDQILTKRALQKARVTTEIDIYETGEDAVAAMADESVRVPDLILLDISLPGMSGHEFLTLCKADDRWRHVPVAAFSSSEAPYDIASSWELGAVAYIVKPSEFRELAEVMDNLTSLYCQYVSLPN